MEQLYYQTIKEPSVAEFKDRGSKFIAYAYPLTTVDDFKTKLNTLKEEHPKAAHYCFAYRLGTEGNSFRANDDGEPSGSAGRPILGQIDSKELTNILVVVVRYFGGTLLGVPGLINAYKTATSLALQLTPVLRKPIMQRASVTFDYTQMNEIMRRLKQFDADIITQDMNLFCNIVFDVPKSKYNDVEYYLSVLQNVELKQQD